LSNLFAFFILTEHLLKEDFTTSGVTHLEFPHRKKNEPQSYAKFPQSSAEFQNISLRNSAIYFAELCG